jgi:hypothetical protein
MDQALIFCCLFHLWSLLFLWYNLCGVGVVAWSLLPIPAAPGVLATPWGLGVSGIFPEAF